jgi:hypothetical protein
MFEVKCSFPSPALNLCPDAHRLDECKNIDLMFNGEVGNARRHSQMRLGSRIAKAKLRLIVRDV